MTRRPSWLRSTTTHARRCPAIAAAGALAVAVLVAGCSASAHRVAVDHQPPPNVSAAVPRAPVSLGPDYQAAVTDVVATTMKLSTTRIKADLAAQPDSTLMNLAKPLGFAQDALAASIRSALSAATAAQVRSGTWTPSQAAQLTTFWTAQTDPSLITRISQWFREQ
jgi:hypothetical protein